MNKLLFYFLLRDKIRYELVILLFLGVILIFENTPDQYGTIYLSILLGILYTIYFQFINQHKNRINLFYNGNTIQKLKKDTIKAISLLSLSLFLIVTILDILILKTVVFSFYHLMTLAIFNISTLLIEINIEKATRTNNKMITFKEGLKIIGLGISLTVLISIVLQFI